MQRHKSEWKNTRRSEAVRVAEQLQKLHGSAPARSSDLQDQPALIGEPAPRRAGFGAPNGYPDLLQGQHRAPREADRKPPEPSDLYASLQDRLALAEQQLQARAGIAEQRAAEQPVRPADLVQTTLYLQGDRFGRTGGRFRCHNPQDTPALLAVRHGRILGDDGREVPGAETVLVGVQTPLGPGESRVLSYMLDLTGAAAGTCRKLDSWIELQAPGLAALRIWIEVDLHD